MFSSIGLDEWPETMLESTPESGALMTELCKFLKIELKFYRFSPIAGKGASEITLYTHYGAPDDDVISLSILFRTSHTGNQFFAWMVPDRKNSSFPVLDFKQCHNCQRWKKYARSDVKSDFATHLKICKICELCGRAFQDGDSHEETCNRANKYSRKERRYEKKQNPDECKLYQKSTAKEVTFKSCWTADFETFSNLEIENGLYQTYCAVLLPPAGEKPEDVLVFYGKQTMDKFMEYVMENVKGILWFFNGAKFDAMLVEKWLIRNDVAITESIMSKSTIISLTFKGHYGQEIKLKDFAKFCMGSLASNCKSFGVDKELSKTDMDHNKMVSWEAVEKYEEEVKVYARQDATALKAVIKAFSIAVFKEHKIHMSKFYTNAGLAYGIFTTSIKDQTLLTKTEKKYENIFREAYRGGRLLCGQKYWFIDNFEELVDRQVNNTVDGRTPKQIYDEILDDMVYIDVNSLYPTVMAGKKYPCGKYNLITLDKDVSGPSTITSIENFMKLPQKDPVRLAGEELWGARLIKVDIDCPNDIFIPFLMSRDPTGRKNGVDAGDARQNLLPKIETWYSGAEIIEAVRLGYKIKKAHAYINFGENVELFTIYIHAIYEMKKAAGPDPKDPNSGIRDPAAYATAKSLMNALSGKFGQKTHETTKIHVRESDYDEEQDCWGDPGKPIIAVFSCLTEDGKQNGHFVHLKNTQTYSNFPIQLSVQILGNSRVYMSQLCDAFNGYRDPKMAPIYGDTDSLIVPRKAYTALEQSKEKEGGWIGNELGQLKNEFPGKKIIGVIILAPKTYMIIFMDEKTYQIQCKMKCKGIPHYTEIYNPFAAAEFTPDETARMEIDLIAHWLRKEDIPVPNVIFKQQRFIVMPVKDFKARNEKLAEIQKLIIETKRKHKKGELNKEEFANSIKRFDAKKVKACTKLIRKSYFLKMLSYQCLMDLHFGNCLVECLYPLMKRAAITHGWVNKLGITPDYASRMVVSNYWWSHGHRKYEHGREGEGRYDLAYPVGHYKYPKEAEEDIFE